MNLVDWSSQNVLGVGLGSCVYLWSALTSKVTQLCDLGVQDSVTSISWISMVLSRKWDVEQMSGQESFNKNQDVLMSVYDSLPAIATF